MPSHKKTPNKQTKKKMTGSILQRCRMASTDGELKPQSLLSLEKQQAQQRPADISDVEGWGFYPCHQVLWEPWVQRWRSGARWIHRGLVPYVTARVQLWLGGVPHPWLLRLNEIFLCFCHFCTLGQASADGRFHRQDALQVDPWADLPWLFFHYSFLCWAYLDRESCWDLWR